MTTSSAGTPMRLPEGLVLSQTKGRDLSTGRGTDLQETSGIDRETRFMASLWGRREDRSYMNKIYCETEDQVPSLESSDWTDALEEYEYDHHVGPFLSKQTWFRLQSPCADKPDGSEPLLVREEYKKLIREIEQHWTAWRPKAKGHRGTVVLGWPGIGKSIFLKIFLAHLLLDSKPVIMSDPQGKVFFAFDGGPDGKGRVRIFQTDFLVPFVEGNRHFTRCLVLHDGTSSLPTGPPYVMTTDSRDSDLWFWVVQATSPKASQWKSWKERAGAHIWCMMPWDWREIWSASCYLMRMDTELAKKAYTQLGPGIRQVRKVEPKNEKALASDTQDLFSCVESICRDSQKFSSALDSAVGDISVPPWVFNEFFLPVPSHNNRQHILLLASSEGVLNRFVACLDHLQASQMEEFRRVVSQNSQAGLLYSQLFERQVLRRMLRRSTRRLVL